MTREEAFEILINTAFLGSHEDRERVEAAIEALSAEAVEVVRCRDCKHLYKDGECPLRTWFTHTEEDFCSYGERREP